MDIAIKTESPKDYRDNETLVREAFFNLYEKGAVEHFIVNKLRKHTDYIPELSLVIEQKDQVVGCIYYSKSKITDEKGNVTDVITFGPVVIHPKFQGTGLGSTLIRNSINKAKRLKYRAIVITGNPKYYSRFGFEPGKKYGISMPDGKFYTGVLALPLYEGALDGVKGTLTFSDVMDVDKSEVEYFDKMFPYKEKVHKPSQDEFKIISSEIDENEY